MYANVDSRNISLFYPTNSERVVIKLNIDDIDGEEFGKEIAKLAVFIKDMTTSAATTYLIGLVREFAKVLDDEAFIRDIQAIDYFLEED